MPSTASFQLDHDIGLIQIDNPPINALSPRLVADLDQAITAAQSHPDVKGLVIFCAHRTFVAGADIAAFDQPGFSARDYSRLFARIEALTLPVVAAMHGQALGGGLELALACHYRLAAPTTRFGFPEVKLGLLPGANGTQRLPRLVGMELALDMMLSGRLLSTDAALAAGLIDEIAADDLLAAAISAARKLAGSAEPIRRISTFDAPVVPEELFAKTEAEIARRPAYPAPAAILRCARAAQLPFAEGCAVELAEFDVLLRSPVSAALRHIFFAERRTRKIPGLDSKAGTRAIGTVGILGAGTMGGGIAMCFANAGIPVALVDATDEALERGLGLIRRNYEASVARGRLSEDQLGQRMALIAGGIDDSVFADCDLVIEAVYENLAIKRDVMARLGNVARPGAIIATNTSTLDVNDLAAASGRPADVVGLHFFSPANVMRLLEIVRGAATADDVLATVVGVAGTIGKVPVVSGVCYGFIGNRMAEAYMREAEFLLMEGALPSAVDGAVEALGMAMGPCRMLDLAGIDVGARTVIEWKAAGGAPADPAYRVLVETLFRDGRLGQKTGAGYYRYEGRKAVDDPALAQVARAVGDAHGIAPRGEIARQEILERLLYPLVNEGCRILEEGIAYHPADIDVVWTAGYGFPDHKGGPMFWAEQVGLRTIAAALDRYAAQRGNAWGYWTPSPLLRKAADENLSLATALELLRGENT